MQTSITWKVMCWDSVDGRLNLFDIETYEAAVKKQQELEQQYPKFTFQIFEQ